MLAVLSLRIALSVGIVTGYWPVDLRMVAGVLVRFLVALLPSIHSSSGAHSGPPATLLWVVKTQGLEHDYTPSTSEGENTWSYIHTSPCAFLAAFTFFLLPKR
jgi:hypothetical protein